MDESGEIRATAFRDLVDKYFDMIEIDKVYYISKGAIKMANKQFNSLKNDYEITLTNETTIQPCFDEVAVPNISYNFVPINKINEADLGGTIGNNNQRCFLANFDRFRFRCDRCL